MTLTPNTYSFIQLTNTTHINIISSFPSKKTINVHNYFTKNQKFVPQNNNISLTSTIGSTK